MKTVLLAGAQEDLKELRRYLIDHFGKSAWLETFDKIKYSVRAIGTDPHRGTVPDEFGN